MSTSKWDFFTPPRQVKKEEVKEEVKQVKKEVKVEVKEKLEDPTKIIKEKYGTLGLSQLVHKSQKNFSTWQSEFAYEILNPEKYSATTATSVLLPAAIEEEITIARIKLVDKIRIMINNKDIDLYTKKSFDHLLNMKTPETNEMVELTGSEGYTLFINQLFERPTNPDATPLFEWIPPLVFETLNKLCKDEIDFWKGRTPTIDKRWNRFRIACLLSSDPNKISIDKYLRGSTCLAIREFARRYSPRKIYSYLDQQFARHLQITKNQIVLGPLILSALRDEINATPVIFIELMSTKFTLDLFTYWVNHTFGKKRMLYNWLNGKNTKNSWEATLQTLQAIVTECLHGNFTPDNDDENVKNHIEIEQNLKNTKDTSGTSSEGFTEDIDNVSENSFFYYRPLNEFFKRNKEDIPTMKKRLRTQYVRNRTSSL